MDEISADNAVLKSTTEFCEPNKMEDDKLCSTNLCHLCHDVGESANASMVCKEEQLYLCEPCGRRHQIQRATKSHKVISIEEDTKKEVLCDLCLGENERIPAYGYCENCEDPEYMCFSCSKRHTASRMFKNHSVNTDLENRPNNSQSPAQDAKLLCGTDKTETHLECSLCAENGESNTASCFCTSCELTEPLCNNCGRHHTRQRDMRGHSLSYDMEAFVLHREANAVKCELCLLDNEINYATSFCLSCQEPEALCKDCSVQHTKQRTFRDHQICDDIGKLPKKEIIWCEPCTIEGSKNEAESFCQDCEDPEPLCNDCAREHVKQRQFRNHLICKDLNQMRRKEKEAVELCAICKDEENEIPATCFCRDCDSPEPLCSECARQHTRQKGFREHKLSDNLSILKDLGREKRDVFCTSCKMDEQNVLAEAYCNDCPDPEPLCNDCARHHTKQKQFRKHSINTNISNFKRFKTPKEKLCDICKLDGGEIIAIAYCKNCEENLCPECKSSHTKFSRDHVVTEKFNDVLSCKLCMRDNKESPATSFCENCNEPMCKTCSKQHLQQKPSRNHLISMNIQLFKPRSSKENASTDDTERLETQNISEQMEKQKPKSTKEIRSKPSVLGLKSDSVELFWEKLEDEEVDYYQIRFKRQIKKDQWKYCNTDDSTNKFTIGGLMADTSYIFQVRSVANDIEGDYSEQSDAIKTAKSLATEMLRFSVRIPNTDPVKYQLLAEENKDARNFNAKTRQLTLGNPSIGSECEKTVMLVGATGSGKSTLVDGFINYILGVSFDDPFRFTLVNLESDEKKTDDQAQSQTEWITVYKITPQEGSRLSYTLNVIDTPGFGDTRGIQRDKAIVDQIRHLFSAEGQQGVTFIDAACFIVKAPDARLTANQTYIFHSIMSLFGKDIESNICTLITFADGAEPPVLSCLQAANLPFGSWFPFNNSALFASNKSPQAKSLSPMFWDMGCKSFQNFFETLKSFQTKSLMQTKDVLLQREHLQSVLSNIQPQVSAGLLKLNELQDTLSQFRKHQTDIEDNKDFTYETEVTKQVQLELPIGQHVTNCLNCNLSCHDNCKFADDDQKSRCSAMGKDGNCKVCTGKCHWSQHKNAKFIFKYVTEKKTETYQKKKELYEKANGEKMTNEKYLGEIEADIDCLFDRINYLMGEMTSCKNRLKEIALRPDHLSTVEQIDQMIQAEEIKKEVGYDKRIKMLNELKQVAQIDKNVENFEQTRQKAKEDLSLATSGKTSEGKGLFRTGIDRMKSIFNM